VSLSRIFEVNNIPKNPKGTEHHQKAQSGGGHFCSLMSGKLIMMEAADAHMPVLRHPSTDIITPGLKSYQELASDGIDRD
jgi:hypothetical protein